MVNDNVFIKIYEMQEKTTVETTCSECKEKIKPDLLFIHVPTDKSEQVRLLSITHLYKKFWDIFKNMNINNLASQNKVEKFMFTVIANIIFYINGKKNPEDTYKNNNNIYENNNICGYLASCLK